MSKIAIQQITLTTADSKGSASMSYDIATSVLNAPIVITFAGQRLVFTTVVSYLDFIGQVALPLVDNLHSVSGTSVGYLASSIGSAGTDPLHN